jgi:hypothetical protein
MLRNSGDPASVRYVDNAGTTGSTVSVASASDLLGKAFGTIRASAPEETSLKFW